MPVLGLALVTSLSLAPPADPGTQAPIVVVVRPAPPAPAPVPVWGPSADVAASRSVPRPMPAPAPRPGIPEEPMQGVGLYISSAVAFTIGLSVRLAQVDSAVRNCSKLRTTSAPHFNTVTACFDSYDPPGLDANDVGVGVAYGTSIVLGMIASGALGRHRAWQTAFGDQRRRSPNARTAFGAIFTGLGVASIAAHYMLVYTNAHNPCTTWECNVERRALWIAASDGGAVLLNTGLGLFSWSAQYKGNLARYQHMQWSVVPGAGRGTVGATATLQF